MVLVWRLEDKKQKQTLDVLVCTITERPHIVKVTTQGRKESTELQGSHTNHNIYDISNSSLSPKMTLSGKTTNMNNSKLSLLFMC